MNWIDRCGMGRGRSGAANTAAAGPGAAAGDEGGTLTAEERRWGCGWFESSLDLRRGLAVVELDEAEFSPG